MTFNEYVFTCAAETFGKRAGFAEPLSPYSRTWKMVCERADHALWLWNDSYGPLNKEQREYAARLVCSSLEHAREEAPTLGDTYAYFHTRLTQLLNHERVKAGFLARNPERDNILLDAVLEVA